MPDPIIIEDFLDAAKPKEGTVVIEDFLDEAAAWGVPEPLPPPAEKPPVLDRVNDAIPFEDARRQAGIGISQGLANFSAQLNTLIGKAAAGVARDLNREKLGLQVTPEEIEEFYMERSARALEMSGMLEQLGQETPGPELSRQVGAGAVSVLPSITPAGVAGGAVAGALQSYALSQAAEDAKARVEGRDPAAAREKAQGPSIAKGLVTLGVTLAGGKTGPEALKSLVRQPSFAKAVKSYLGHTVGEGVEEATDEFLQGVIDKVSLEPDKPWSQILAEAGTAGLVGSILGSFFHAPTLVPTGGQALQAGDDTERTSDPAPGAEGAAQPPTETAPGEAAAQGAGSSDPEAAALEAALAGLEGETVITQEEMAAGRAAAPEVRILEPGQQPDAPGRWLAFAGPQGEFLAAMGKGQSPEEVAGIVQGLVPGAEPAGVRVVSPFDLRPPEGPTKGADVRPSRPEDKASTESPAAEAAPEPDPEPVVRPPAAEGKAWQASTPQAGAPVQGSYALVEAADLVSSFDPEFDPELQPRDRSREASGNQIAGIVARFEPQRLGAAATTDLGAPITDERHQVLSGNGRVRAIRTIYQSGRGQGYRQWLTQNAGDFGLEPDQVEGMSQPVLVRRVTDHSALSKAELARQSNQQQVLGMGEAEKAVSDAKMLLENPQLLRAFVPDESGNVTAASNNGFLQGFVQGTGDSGELLGREGYNKPVLARRVRNAVLGAFIGPEDQQLMGTLIEQGEELGIKRAVDGVIALAPRLVRYHGTDYDLGPVVHQGLKQLVDMKQRGESAEEYLGSLELIADPERTAESDFALSQLARGRSVKQVAEWLGRYDRAAAEALQDQQSGGLLGGRPATRREILERTADEDRSQEANPQDLALGEPPALAEEGSRGAEPAGQGAEVDIERAPTGPEITRYLKRAGVPYEKRAKARETIRSEERKGRDVQDQEFGEFREGAAEVPEPSMGGWAGRSVDVRRRAGGEGTPTGALAGPFPARIGEFREAFSRSNRVTALVHRLVKTGQPWAIQGATVETAEDLFRLARAVRNPYFETIRVVLVDEDNRVVHAEVLAQGTLDRVVADGRTMVGAVQRAAARKGLRKVRAFVTHNHPGGNPAASEADLKADEMLRSAFERMGWELLDHVITNGNTYYSVRNRQLGRVPDLSPADAWEAVNRQELPVLGSSFELGELAQVFRQVNPNHRHVFFLNRRNQVQAVQRIPSLREAGGQEAAWMAAVEKDLAEAIAWEQPYQVAVDLQGEPLPVAKRALKRWDELLHREFNVVLADAVVGPGGRTALKRGWLNPRRDRGDYAGEFREGGPAQQEGPYGGHPEARKAWDIYAALIPLARRARAEGMLTAQSFADSVGLPNSGVLAQAWADTAEEGTVRQGPAELSPETIAQTVSGFRRRQRNFSGRHAADPRIAQPVRAATGNREYNQIPNTLTNAEALAIVDELGIEAAMARMMNEQAGDPERVRSMLGQAILQRLNAEYHSANRRGDTVAAEAALDASVTAAEWLTEFGTRLGQGVQAFAAWARMTPEGHLRAYQRAVKKAREQKQAKNPNKAPDKLNLPKVDPKVEKEVLRRAQRIQKLPEGFQREEATIDLMAFIAKQQPLSWVDIALGFWYANILSSWRTQALNMISTTWNVGSELAVHSMVHPEAAPQMVMGLYNGMIRGWFDAGNILKTGKVTGTRLNKVEAPRALELLEFQGPARVLNAWKYVSRVMAATDMVFFRGAEEMKAQLLARHLAKQEGLHGDALTRRVAEILHNTPAARAQAERQARAEGLEGNNYRRRVAEILEQARPAELVSDSADFGRMATFNGQPQGTLGFTAKLMADAGRALPAFRLVVPFTNVVANVSNIALDYTPWGYKRLFFGRWGGNRFSEAAPEFASDAWKMQAAKATLGTTAMGMLVMMAARFLDDEDPWFMITGSGPSHTAHRHQLRQTGWEPYTVKIGGHYYNYLGTNLHLALSIVGNYLDSHRYDKLDERERLSRLAYALQLVPGTLLDQSFLTGVADLVDGLNNSYAQRDVRKLFPTGRRLLTSIAVPNIVKDVDRAFDPYIYEAETLEGAFMQDIPVARQQLRPVLNGLGERVKPNRQRFYSADRPDPLWQVIARKQAWISQPSKYMMVGDRTIRPDEYYNYVKESGQGIRRRLDPLVPRLEAMEPEAARDLVGRVVREERERAKRKLRLK